MIKFIQKEISELKIVIWFFNIKYFVTLLTSKASSQNSPMPCILFEVSSKIIILFKLAAFRFSEVVAASLSCVIIYLKFRIFSLDQIMPRNNSDKERVNYRCIF